MFSVLAGAAFLLLVALIVKTVETKGKTPYFLAYLVVIMAGFYGGLCFSNTIDLLKNSPIEAGMNLLIGIVGLVVMSRGLSTFKRMQMES